MFVSRLEVPVLRLIVRLIFGSSSAPTRRAHLPREKDSRSVWQPERASQPRVAVGVRVTEPAPARQTTISGKCYVIDGDTIQIGEVRLRLAGIDAPEIEHPWGKKAKWELAQLCKGQLITAEIAVDISYDRLVATCYLPAGRDLSAEMVRRGLALDWHNFSGGKYAHLEPEGARKRHWKAAARQRGHMQIFQK